MTPHIHDQHSLLKWFNDCFLNRVIFTANPKSVRAWPQITLKTACQLSFAHVQNIVEHAMSPFPVATSTVLGPLPRGVICVTDDWKRTGKVELLSGVIIVCQFQHQPDFPVIIVCQYQPDFLSATCLMHLLANTISFCWPTNENRCE